MDLFKLFCAVLVIAIHTKPFADNFWLDNAVGLVTRFAVPFFFTASAYFLFAKIKAADGQSERAIITKYLLRLLRFYVIWYGIINLFDIAVGGKVQSIGYYLKHFFFTNNGSPLWFVNALLWAVLSVGILRRFLGDKAILVLSLVCFAVGYSQSTLYGVTGAFWDRFSAVSAIRDFIGIQNGLFFAFPYVALGMNMAQTPVQKHGKRDIIGAAVCFALLGAESVLMVIKFHAPLTFLWISAIPMTYFTVRFLLSADLTPKPIYYGIRKISTLVYVIHIIIFKLLQRMAEVTAFGSLFDSHNIVLFLLTTVLSVGISAGIVALSETKPFRFVRFIM